MLRVLLGIFKCFKIDVAATASGGELIPPSKNPIATVIPGIILEERYATTMEVRKTKPKASPKIGLLNLRKSFHEVFHAASKEWEEGR